MSSPQKRRDRLAGRSQGRITYSNSDSNHTRDGRADQRDRRFVVLCQKFGGRMIEYGRYADHDEANRVCGLLRWAGAVAVVEEAA